MRKHWQVETRVFGERTEGRMETVAVLVKVLLHYAGEITFHDPETGERVPDSDVEFDHAMLVLQNVAAQPESFRGIIAALASVPHSRADRLERDYQEQRRRHAAETKRRADATSEATESAP